MTNSRRDFIHAGATLALGAAFAQPASALSRRSPQPVPGDPLPFRAPPMERVRIGFVGVGGQGTTHVENLLSLEGVDLKAICDIDESHARAASEKIVAAGQPAPTLYTRGPRDFERLRGGGPGPGVHRHAVGVARAGAARPCGTASTPPPRSRRR